MKQVLAIVGMGPGVSAAVARRFGREGFTIAALARRPDALKQQTDALAAAGVDARGYVADAADAGAVTAALGRVGDELGAPGVLVYNAAGVRHKPLAGLAPGELMADLQISVGGALASVQAVLPAMKAGGGGTLLFTGGGFAFEPMPALASLGMGKAALRNLAFSLYAELKDSGVHAATVTICGLVKPGTPFDPDRIAECYWQLHTQPAGAYERAIQFRG